MWFAKQKSKTSMQRNSITTAHNMPAKLMINPLIVVNMGAEMIYILQQRLKAQNISNDKSSRVLADTVTALFEMSMVSKIFEPCNMWQSAAFRELFHNVTHSSIMRLNDQSMDKLYDLMIMGLKVQVVTSRDPFELVESTLNHIDNVTSIVQTKVIDCYQVAELITSMRDRIIQTYTVLNYGKLLNIRNLLLQFLQDRRIKVSILLQKDLQANNGYVKIFTNGILPKYCDIPGKYQRQNGNQRINEPNMVLPNSKNCHQNGLAYSWQFGKLNTNIGNNLYANSGDEGNNNGNINNGVNSFNGSNQSSNQESQSGSTYQSPQRLRSNNIDPEKRKSMQKAATNELNFLASMIVTDDVSANSDKLSNSTSNHPQLHTRHSMLEFFDTDNDNLIALDFDVNHDTNQNNNNDNKKKKNKKNDANVVHFGNKTKQNRLEKALQELDLGETASTNPPSKGSMDFDSVNAQQNSDLLALIDDDDDDDAD